MEGNCIYSSTASVMDYYKTGLCPLRIPRNAL